MPPEPPPSSRPDPETSEAEDALQAEPSARDRKIARGRTLYDNVGTFGDVFKIVVIVALLLAIVIVFLF